MPARSVGSRELDHGTGDRQLCANITSESARFRREKACSPTPAVAPSHHDRADNCLLGDDRAPMVQYGAGYLLARGIPADDNGKAGSIAAIRAGFDVRARDESGDGAVAQTCDRKCEATEASAVRVNSCSRRTSRFEPDYISSKLMAIRTRRSNAHGPCHQGALPQLERRSRWYLVRDLDTGRVFVRHQTDLPSGGLWQLSMSACSSDGKSAPARSANPW
jgi:hypothetical protein